MALSASLPYITSRYDGPYPDNPDLDNGDFHGGFQNLAFQARYLAVTRPLVITPYFALVIPSHAYETLGHTAIGTNLMEVQFGVYLGKLLTFVSDNLVAQVGYDYVNIETHHDIKANQSNLDVSLGYFVSDAISVTTVLSYLKTNGVIDWLDINDEATFHAHDQHAAASYLHLGGSVSIDVTDALGFSVGYMRTLWGQNTHEIEAVTIGTTWNFELPPLSRTEE